MDIINKLHTLADENEKQLCLAILMILKPFAPGPPLPIDILNIVEPEIKIIRKDLIYLSLRA
jgi:hypothetical protein